MIHKIPKIKYPFKYSIQTSYFIMNPFKFLEKMNSHVELLHPNTLLVFFFQDIQNILRVFQLRQLERINLKKEKKLYFKY